MNKEYEFDYEIGSDNVFADLELEDADELLLRSEIGRSIRLILKDKGLSQQEIAKLLNIDQAEVSKFMNGKYHLFSEGRLFRFLNKLNLKVTIQITPRQENDVPQEVICI